jgi:hypothetical protein
MEHFIQHHRVYCILDDDYTEENQGDVDKEEEIIMNDDTASPMSDSLAVLMEDLDEDEDEDDEELITQQPQMITATIPVQPAPTPSHMKRKPPLSV